MIGADSPAASKIASRILERADRDLAFIPKLMGESLYLLTRHFVGVIERGFTEAGIRYGDHPLLKPFVELHSRELTDYVLNGIGLRHQFGLQTLECMAGDPLQLLRVDLWDSLSGLIEDAERSFVTHPEGLQSLVRKVHGAERATGASQGRREAGQENQA